MTKPTYTAQTIVTGGRNGVGKTADGSYEVQLKGPVEMGGNGGGANPEQLFAIGFAACFETNLRHGARRDQLDPKGTTIKSNVHLLPKDGGGFKLGVDMDVSMPNIADKAQVAALIRKADEGCPYSNAIRGNVDVNFTIDGEPLA